jgi:hypothetical protein
MAHRACSRVRLSLISRKIQDVFRQKEKKRITEAYRNLSAFIDVKKKSVIHFNAGVMSGTSQTSSGTKPL